MGRMQCWYGICWIVYLLALTNIAGLPMVGIPVYFGCISLCFISFNLLIHDHQPGFWEHAITPEAGA